jgi:hypothetical protein
MTTMKRDATYDALSSTPAVRATLAALRRRIRAYVWIEAAAAAVAWLGAAFWASLAADWFFEPSAVVRAVILAAATIATVAILFRLVGRCSVVPLGDRNVAAVLERRFPQLNDGLLTAVVLAERRPEEAGFNADMLAHTCAETARRVEGLELAAVFNFAPLRRMLAAALVLAAAIVVFAITRTSAMELWARRTFALSEEIWPRKTQLTVWRWRHGAGGAELVKFTSGPVKVAGGADLEVVVRADTAAHLAPDRVEVRYRSEDGAHRPTMKRMSGHRGRRQNCEEYSYTFHSVLASTRFDVVGGDDAVRDLQIEVVKSPTLTEMTLDRRFPAYMELEGTPVFVTGAMQIPMGTQLTLHCRANKELVQVQIDFPPEQKAPRGPQILSANRLTSDRRGFGYALEPLMEDTTLLFTLLDSDGIQNREPVRLSLVAIPDLPPQVAVRLLGIGMAVTPQARLPVAGRITDDYGIARLWFEYTVDRQPPAVAEEVALPRHPTDWPLAEKAMELRPVNVKAGQKLLVALKAADLCDLPPKRTANVGSSERWLLDVVTPDQLRTMLEAREAVLRWRFKSIVDEVTQTRDVLLRTRFGQTVGKGKAEKKPPAAAAGKASGSGTSAWPPPGRVPLLACPAVPSSHGWTSHPWRPADALATSDSITGGFVAADAPPTKRLSSYPEGAEPGEEPESLQELSPEQQGELQKSMVQLAVQTSRKNAQETAGVAEGFDDIRLQLANNRIDSEALRMRLGSGIIQPLHKIVERMFPELERRLDDLEGALADPRRGSECPELAHLAQKQADDILLAMQAVLNHMLEMLDYNQMVEQLRNLIKQQDEVGRETKQRDTSQFRESLEK